MLQTASPIQAQDRNQLIDVLRGVAILGILMANLEGWVVYALPPDQAALLMTNAADHVTETFLLLFIENKFITLFSLLFGYGFGVVIERVAAKRIPVTSFFMRRMFILLLIGLLHLALWWGEILSTYALCGILLLLFRRVSDRGLLIWGALFLFFVGPFIQGLKLFLLTPPDAALDQLFVEYMSAIRGSNLLNIAEYNYKMIDFLYIKRWSQFRDMSEILGKFLFGYYILRKNYLSPTTSNASLFKRVQLIVLSIAILYLVEKSILHFYHIELTSKSLELLLYTFDRVGILSLTLFYAISIALLFHKGKLNTLSTIFRPVGMMSLTNYLTHTVFYVTFYYGIGFNMLGKLHLYWLMPIAFTIYTLQILISRLWMSKMQYGPIEWLWRQATYGKRLPLARDKSS